MVANHCVDILGLKVFFVKKNVTIFYNLQSLYKFKSRKKVLFESTIPATQ